MCVLPGSAVEGRHRRQAEGMVGMLWKEDKFSVSTENFREAAEWLKGELSQAKLAESEIFTSGLLFEEAFLRLKALQFFLNSMNHIL